jgi:hypothetical protein
MLWFRSSRKQKSTSGRSTATPISNFVLGSTVIPSGPAAQAGIPTLAPRASAFVRRRLTPEDARGLEMLGHAIEYLADEYAIDTTNKGPLGNADPRIEAIQILKALNRAVYFSGTVVEPSLQRIRRWILGERTA